MDRLQRIAAALKRYSPGLAREVAEVSLAIKMAAKPQTGKINASLRSKINRELVAAGFGGRGRWEKPGIALADAGGVLHNNGIEFADIVNAHTLAPSQGHTSIDLAFTNNEDVYSPIPITNSMLVFTWTELEKYRYESIAYIS